MARGHMFYITTVKDQDISFSADSYYEKLDAIGTDHLNDLTVEASAGPIQTFLKSMTELGATIEYGHFDDDLEFSFRFVNIEEVQQNWFRPKLEKLKKEAEKLTLFDVIRAATCLDYIVNNDYEDLIAFDTVESNVEITVDDFIRQLKPGVTYYLYKKVILMH